MIFTPVPIKGAFLIDIEPKEDDRGFFARLFCENEFRAAGINPVFKQCNMQHNAMKGTLRGLHLQFKPHAEEKLMQCTRGAVYDAIVDLRTHSLTYKQWFGVELNAENRRMIYIPKGVAHGYVTLTDNTETFYMVTEFYSPECEWGVRFNDPAFNIKWPDLGAFIISEKDRNWPMFGRSAAVVRPLKRKPI